MYVDFRWEKCFEVFKSVYFYLIFSNFVIAKELCCFLFFFGRGDGLRQYRRDGTGQVAIFGYEKKSMA